MDEISRDTEVLSLTGEKALAWYQAIASGKRATASDFQWQSLAQGAALRARITEADESLAWAELATSVFDRLASETPAGSFAESSMYCRVAMIEKHGVQANDRLRDPAMLFQWFREEQPADYEGTLRLIQRLTDEMSEDFEAEIVSPLRNIKSRLNVIRALPSTCEVPEDVRQFVKIWADLP